MTSYDDIAVTFRPTINRIAAGAVEREDVGALPYEEVRWLREAGFGALRVPVEFGGRGIRLEDLFRLLIELGEADSNLPQLLRGHVAFVETQRAMPESAQRTEWLTRIARREILFGNAQAERSDSSTQSTTLTEVDGRLLLNGRKYYSTGTLFADWIWSGGKLGDEFVAFAVPAEAPGVTRIDDWDGFGQRLTGSGTTVFEDVEIDPAHVLPWDESDRIRPLAYTTGLYQGILLASLAGIARAVLRDAISFVQPRTRTFGIPGNSVPREEPLVQRVVGRLASLRFAVEATVLEAIRRLEDADTGRRFDSTDDARYSAALIAVFEAQQVVIDLVLQASTLLFEVGGASAVSIDRRLDRFWRNARTIASHNPAIYREQAIGDYYLNGTLPRTAAQVLRSESAGVESAASAFKPAPVG
ncbi:acyl-CoA dehydrogenase family protein [Salinibacterium sp. ZJ450]|uniref:acyl-CoA dehydrogenase family protein n=1 Tax=Salinibacterium sp. ZJ450 TaxID=2708338 RepID=UPI00141FC870|nr:acyl-CoA dehydrogenase family protein [Salinibacterium sp. ZJ450]